MKAQMIEKNGFPRPIGFMMIFLLISLICFAQCLFNQTANANTTGEKFDLAEVEKTTEIQAGTLRVNESTWN